MNLEDCIALERALQRKWVKRAASAVAPLAPMTNIIKPMVVPPLARVDLLIDPPLSSALIKGDVAPPVAEAPSLLSGGDG